ncbi:MAG: alpha-1,3-galactosidase B [Bacteroidales bacterium]|nr:alpha-1,3-galactosidase B [Bacteroidales bacterium]
MNRYTKTLILIFVLLFSSAAEAKKTVIDISKAPYFFLPDEDSKDNASRLNEILLTIKNSIDSDDEVVIRFKKARYDFYPQDAQQREYYISNHDQNQPKAIGICLEQWNKLTIDGNGSEFIFHGQMLPIAVVNSSNITLTDFSIDFENPHIAQVEILHNDENEGISFRVEPWVSYRINENGIFETYGEGWKYQQNTGIAFEKESRHIVYQTSDLWINTKDVVEIGERRLHAPNWKDKRLKAGTIVAMRTWKRPAPGIFLDHSNDTYINKVNIHYAEGMGLLAQRCCNIRLNHFNVCLKENDKRYFTTQADATHFSQCKGMIRSEHGLYEGMMDDAINVHGVYLKVKERCDNNTLICRYEHSQAWGFAWGDTGDSVCFVRSKSMEMLDHINIIKEIRPYDKDVTRGAKEFIITFEKELPEEINKDESFGIENLCWTPEVIFSHNIVRNNRARGALFSSPLRTVCEDNIFDHTSGTAILLCGDCNGWYESGAVRDLVIRNNTFINALTNMFQFTNAVISIYPEIPELEKQTSYFHGGKKDAIVIEKNHFITFDNPLLYAKSVDGLIFRKNKVTRNNDYEPFHWNQKEVLLERVNNHSL